MASDRTIAAQPSPTSPPDPLDDPVPDDGNDAGWPTWPGGVPARPDPDFAETTWPGDADRDG